MLNAYITGIRQTAHVLFNDALICRLQRALVASPSIAPRSRQLPTQVTEVTGKLDASPNPKSHQPPFHDFPFGRSESSAILSNERASRPFDAG